MFTYTDNLGFLPDYGARLFPEKAALIQEGLQLTYSELDARANRVAQSLLLAGVSRGDRVFMVFANDVRFAECLFGIMRAGAVAVPANPNLSVDALVSVLQDSGARVVLATASVGETASRLRQNRLCDLAVVLDCEGAATERYDAWLASAPSIRPEMDTDPGDACMQPYTSGSTGRPKGVLLSHEGLLRNLELVRHAAMLQADDRLLVSTPLFHLNASVSGLLPCLMAGGTAVVLPSFDPVAVIRAIDRHKCTYTQGVPAMYKLVLAQRDELEGRDLSSMRFLTCGSTPMPKSLLDELGTVFPGITVVEGYGLSEGGPVTTLLPRWGTRKLGSIGLPLPGIETKLVADDGLTEVDPGEVGELWVRSAMNALGYHNLHLSSSNCVLPSSLAVDCPFEDPAAAASA